MLITIKSCWFNIKFVFMICDPPHDFEAKGDSTLTTRLVCPEDTDMRIIIGKTKEDTLALFGRVV